MVLDFGQLSAGSPEDQATEPRKLFTSLTKKKASYNYLRDVQAQVLEQWYDRRKEKDLVLKMNTGSGKTIVGLLVLKSSLNDGQGPGVYVAPDNFLVEQVVAEAQNLGLTVARSENDPSFVEGRAILVANTHKVFNGRSVFGVGRQGSKIPIGTIVIDDAHSCLATVVEQFMVKISRTFPAYKSLLELFAEDLKTQSVIGLHDLQVEDPNSLMMVPFWAWHSKHAKVAEILNVHRDADEIKFNWPLVREILKLCTCVFSASRLEISPRCIPVDLIPSFAKAQRRVYMTATLADDGVLVTEFQADPDSIRRPVTPKGTDDLGERMIIAPQEINPGISADELKKYILSISRKRNVVVIVPSKRRAEDWKDYAAQILSAENLRDGIRKLRDGHVGLTVLINKYDGVDLPGNSCRVLVIDGLPDVTSLFDRVEISALDGTDEAVGRQVQKIEQGMGRGIRSNEDYCVVLLIGPQLTQRIHLPNSRRMFSPATQAQLDLSRKVGKQLEGKSLAEIGEAIDLCLNRDAGWISASKGALIAAGPAPEGVVSEITIKERKAFDLARVDSFPKARDEIQAAVNGMKEPRLKGWLKQELASYTNHFDAAQAQEILQSALEENGRLLRPIGGIAYSKLHTPATDQAAMAVGYYKRTFLEINDLVLSAEAMLDDLIFEPETADRFEAAVRQLGLFLGFGSHRPEAEYRDGPDNLWALGALRFVVIECKNGAKGARIAKDHVNQLGGSINWFKKAYDHTCTAVPLLIHISNVVEGAATAPEGMKVLNGDCLMRLKVAIRNVSRGIAATGRLDDLEAVRRLLEGQRLTASTFVDTFSIPSK